MSKLTFKLILSTALGATFLIAPSVIAKQKTEREIAEKNETMGEYLDDAALTTKVKAALVGERHLSAADIHVITTQNVVELNGIVNSSEEKRRAEEAASKVKGIIKVINNLELRTPRNASEKNETVGEYVSDAAVTAKVKAKLKAESYFDASDIKVTTVKNSVELTGTVRSVREKQKAENLALSVNGAHEVINNLTVR
ncbi:MAG: BON domain-containing protein [Candidatus Paracaedimonas acanthamoebae]|uniref:BON domain-containing protein n=1 Tax=Candidatus Paracaedimonas acanthamoebae TaxID=244581 RepID=A0A8J7TV10_9PROT|nr:BON domain-containing protein [Candidatus Paracaedimonas acanthamoebae]